MTSARWKNAIVNKGCRAIWFDPDADNQPRSLECIELNSALVESSEQTSEKHKSTPVALPSLQLQCELDPLLKVLPTEYQHAILAIDNYHGKLVDVCLDVGRTPYVYTGKRQRAVLTQDGSTVSKETIDEVLRKLGGEMRIGNDNRVGIDQQLHRISVMRSKTDEVYGLTMRVGRALRNAACSLTDLLLSQRHNNKSVLVLGHPGSGKTTLIRDVARCVSETMENNHTVETLIIDEIGRKAEVLAASTVRQRGPRLIASAHGDFRALIKNPDLKGLVGGSQQVLVGDATAAKSPNKSKLQTQRAGNPIFDVIVELDHVIRSQCRIIWDVAKAVDCVLGGQCYSFETRQWDSSTCGVQVIDC
ncbi:hypothetical protein BBO99_00002899 [Phytophthora kernoviae]|uniref:AAA+ ATPase domain-containing protein n=2 Tax=Phytophthora kernoviae TaxID=325452 RepID=A0A3R7H221_9STRA|nr:hypothetical protein G195_004529 [Phytophthora kernoviae 00238/432]KAG2523832.1 hypothetical protein JM16_002309 [Phytophthora kernoviae]KAG2525618.1 hypothetical protein JM18_002375 [Phytophthora kernoviae]RLN38175.1 hypothetical protein BBI17_002891 [Phytophthora kernoviae]RLN82446.1 hypothetical protein BBO99_00002899 [Phytophthora kernoviae]